jgi:ADP-ribosylglycohydrolase
MVAQALLASGGNPDQFARSLAWRLRGWLLGAPAGVGWATLRALLKLWIGFPPSRAGVWSAGNGPAMRAALLGLYAGPDDALLSELVRASTRLTHTDPLAEHGALAVALAARFGATRGGSDVNAAKFFEELERFLPPGPLLDALRSAVSHLAERAPLDQFARSIGCNGHVSGFVNHTVPVAICAWLRSPADFRQAVQSVIALGGDTDTTGAIAGALVGATAGAQAIPNEWLATLVEWPRSVEWLRRLAARIAETEPASPGKPLPLLWPAIPIRNAVFLLLVFGHGLRRLLPPY